MGAYVYESHLGGLYTSDDYISPDELYCEQCGDSDLCLGCYNTFREFIESNADIIDADDGWGGYNLKFVIDNVSQAFDDRLTYEESKEIVLNSRTLDEEDE